MTVRATLQKQKKAQEGGLPWVTGFITPPVSLDLLRLVTTSQTRGLLELGAEPGKSAGRQWVGHGRRQGRVGGHQKAGRAEAAMLPKQTAHNPTFLGTGCAPYSGQELHPPWPPCEGGWKAMAGTGPLRAPFPTRQQAGFQTSVRPHGAPTLFHCFLPCPLTPSSFLRWDVMFNEQNS